MQHTLKLSIIDVKLDPATKKALANFLIRKQIRTDDIAQVLLFEPEELMRYPGIAKGRATKILTAVKLALEFPDTSKEQFRSNQRSKNEPTEGNPL